MKKQSIIDLAEFRTPGSRVFTGRDRGIEVREQSEIDKIERESERILIKIPDDIGSINPSFLEEFLFHIVVKLKPDAFFDKVQFENNGRYKIDTDLKEAVDRILRDESALIH